MDLRENLNFTKIFNISHLIIEISSPRFNKISTARKLERDFIKISEYVSKVVNDVCIRQFGEFDTFYNELLQLLAFDLDAVSQMKELDYVFLAALYVSYDRNLYLPLSDFYKNKSMAESEFINLDNATNFFKSTLDTLFCNYLKIAEKYYKTPTNRLYKMMVGYGYSETDIAALKNPTTWESLSKNYVSAFKDLCTILNCERYVKFTARLSNVLDKLDNHFNMQTGIKIISEHEKNLKAFFESVENQISQKTTIKKIVVKKK